MPWASFHHRRCAGYADGQYGRDQCGWYHDFPETPVQATGWALEINKTCCRGSTMRWMAVFFLLIGPKLSAN